MVRLPFVSVVFDNDRFGWMYLILYSFSVVVDGQLGPVGLCSSPSYCLSFLQLLVYNHPVLFYSMEVL